MIELDDIAYVRSGAADLDTAVRFATDIVGMELIAGDVDTAYLRVDQRHHCLCLVRGESGVLASAFAVRDESALAAAADELTAAGLDVQWGSAEEAAARKVRKFIAFDDPFGNRIELVAGQIQVHRPVRFTRPAGITEFGHLCLDAPDVAAAYAFWSSHFNVRASDWIGQAACLMRIDPVHHKLAVFQGDGPGLCHINFQVASIDDVMRSWHFLERNGVEITMGPGRHPQSTAIFLYFQGPEGFSYEYSYGVRRIEDEQSWRPRYFDPSEPDAIDLWEGTVRRTTTQRQLDHHQEKAE
ncbi:VOC family protein [Nocardia sp. Marseille-Q1738]